uniref:Nudix hydrolase domain-containing protein n=2 Tax=Denticeps clupeoides TaxID=299321 RepID=A0A8C3ZRE0_9TELE
MEFVNSRKEHEVSVMLHCAPWRGLREQHVQVELSARFNRHSISHIDQQIETQWSQRIAEEPWIFNGAKFRLHSAIIIDQTPETLPNCVCDGGELQSERISQEPGFTHLKVEPSKQKDGCQKDEIRLCLQLGLTCYKDYLGTNWSRDAKVLQRRGQDEFGDPQVLLAQPLGVGAVMTTADHQVVLLRRSQRVAEATGLLDIPGGHPEPKTLCEGASEACISIDLLRGKEKAVVAEIFMSVCAEIRDEVNVPLSSLGEPVLLGIALNHTSAGRPSAEFCVRCSLTAKEVQEFYWRGGPEAHESTDIMFLTEKDLLCLDESAPLWSELCPSAKGAVMLYRKVMDF